MYGLRYNDGPLYVLTSALQRLTTACETHRMRHVSRRRMCLMFDVQGHWQCTGETGTIYDDVFTASTRRRYGLTWAGACDQDWCHVTLTRSANYSIRTQQQAGIRVSGHWTGVAVLISLRLWHYADEHSRPFCTHSLGHHWCDCHIAVPTPGSQCAAW